MVLGPISLIFCGHLGDPIQLDGAALAISVSNPNEVCGKGMFSVVSICLSVNRGYPHVTNTNAALDLTILPPSLSPPLSPTPYFKLFGHQTWTALAPAPC